MQIEEKRMIEVYGLILLAVLINVTAQLLLKLGMQKIGYFEFTAANIVPVGLQVAKSIPIIIGIGGYVLSVIVWMMVLSRADVSMAYPLSSLAYIFVALAAWWLLDENLSAMRVIGIFIIIFGVFLVSRTA